MKKFLKGFMMTILVIILFLSATGLLLLLPIKNTLSKNSIKGIISSFEIEKMANESPQFQETIDEVFEPIYESAREFGIDDETIIKIIDSKEVKSLIGDVTGNIVDYAITGKNQKLINTENIEELVSNAIDDINESGYFEINQEDKDSVLKIVRKEVIENQDLIPDTDVIEENIDNNMHEKLDIIRFILGNKLMICLIVTTLLSISGILALKWKGAKWIKNSSITIMISSILTSIITAVLIIANNMLFKEDYSYIFDIVNKGINFSLILSIGTFVAMVVILIIYHINSKKKVAKIENK